MKFDSFIGIDWSGDKNKSQKGLSIALCKDMKKAPKIIKPKEDYWSRTELIDWLVRMISKKKTLVGFDFSFSYPFYDYNSYFPGLKDSPINPLSLWKFIDKKNSNKKNFYGGEIWNVKPFADFYNSPKLKGPLFKSRRRVTEIYAKEKICSPSPTFNCVGPGSVGTGTLAGMRVLNLLKNKLNIWPFNNDYISNKSVLVEIFPTYYFRYTGVKPEKKLGYTLKNINKSLKFFNSDVLDQNTNIGGPDQDDADAIISAAALRFFSSEKDVWNVPRVSKKEGWIFGV